jgi:hypothetical protein
MKNLSPVFQLMGIPSENALSRLLSRRQSGQLVENGWARYRAGDFSVATNCANGAINLWEKNPTAWALGAACLAAVNDHENALNFLQRAAELDPGNDTLAALAKQRRFWSAWHKLSCGEWTPEAWEGWEERFQLTGISHDGETLLTRVIDASEYWDGKSSLIGKTLFLDLEGGLGDIAQYGRCVPIIRAAGARIIVMLDPYSQRITPLLRLCSSIDEILPVNARCRENVPPHDVALLASAFTLVHGTTFDNVPDARWLSEPPLDRMERARVRIGRGGLKIGLSWASTDSLRNISLSAFAELATIPGVRLFGLQRGKAAKELEGVNFEVTNLESDDGDCVDTAAAMLELDLIISVDSFTAHLAGALGRPCFTLLPTPCDWRWIRKGSSTPWYPTMRLFRQVVKGDWSGPVAEVVEAVKAATTT